MLAPTTVGFLLMWFCIVLIMFRGNKVRTYNVALFLEVAIIGLWVSLEHCYCLPLQASLGQNIKGQAWLS